MSLDSNAMHMTQNGLRSKLRMQHFYISMAYYYRYQARFDTFFKCLYDNTFIKAAPTYATKLEQNQNLKLKLILAYPRSETYPSLVHEHMSERVGSSI